eukprot:Hpha_TRINITY_DN16023_c9_g2::TRINITY_DN16023_c9_g2_i1::g.120052::m.120052
MTWADRMRRGDDGLSCITCSSQGLTHSVFDQSPGTAPEQAAAWPPVVTLTSSTLELAKDGGEDVDAVSKDALDSVEVWVSSSSDTSSLENSSPGTRSLLSLAESSVTDGTARLRPVSQDCAGGTYLLEDTRSGIPLGVFKPRDEEPATEGNPKGVTSQEELQKAGFTAGEMWRREIAAFHVDQGFAGVPETVEFNFQGQAGSLQAFRRSQGESWDFLPAKFKPHYVRRVALLDLVILNCDRHGGNMLVSEEGDGLIPIDHGLSLPSSLEDLDFEWQFWPQSNTAFDDEERRWVQFLPAGSLLSAQLRALGIDEASADLAGSAAVVLKVGVEQRHTARMLAGLWRREKPDDPSWLERLIERSSNGRVIDFLTLERLAREEMQKQT